MKKTSRDIHPRNIPTNFEKNQNIGCRVRGVDGRTDRQTDRPTDRRRATAIGPVDLKIKKSLKYLGGIICHGLDYLIGYEVVFCFIF